MYSSLNLAFNESDRKTIIKFLENTFVFCQLIYFIGALLDSYNFFQDFIL